MKLVSNIKIVRFNPGESTIIFDVYQNNGENLKSYVKFEVAMIWYQAVHQGRLKNADCKNFLHLLLSYSVVLYVSFQN